MSEKHYDSPGTYVGVMLVLLVLTAVTTAVAFVNIGVWNIVAGIGLAVAKASLVFWFFMHLRHATGLTRIVALGGLFWLGVMLALTLADFTSRGLLQPSL